MSTQREIKFRVWDGAKMLSPLNSGRDELLMDMDGELKWYSERDYQAGCTIAGTAKLVLMQFTGLKDKNGNGVYEKDLPSGIYEEGEVRWCEQCHGWTIGMAEIPGHCHQCDGDFMWLDFVDDLNTGKTEIIGNSYEIKPLL